MSSEVESRSLKEPSQGADGYSNPTSSWDGQKKNIPGTPTPERAPDSPSSSSSSGDTCSICLGSITDKCVADSCLHSFCLLCLKEWSKQKAVCPLCKLGFTKIMYEIKSETEYKEWKVPLPDPPERNQGIANFQEFLNAETRRFFGYRTTHFPGAATLRRMHVRANIPDAIPSLPPQRGGRSSLRGSTMFRLSVYLNNVWVQPLADVTGRYRQTSPELYREQPALTHRLVPWVNRELAALISPSRVGTALTEVMDLIERYPINSREFRAAVRPHLRTRTQHFVHEFYHFARSPYDMVGHDNSAQYVPRYGPDDDSSDGTDSDDDSDAVVEVDSVGNPIASTSVSEGSRSQPTPGNVVREETLTQEGSVVISSSDDSDNESERPHSQNTEASYEMTHNPEPPMSGMRRQIGQASVGFYMSVNEGASTSRSGSASGRRADQSTKPSQDNVSGIEDSDECIIVEEVVPKVPTPELIEIDSDDEEEPHSNTGLKENHKTVKARKKLRGKSKPTLKRNNFVGVESSCNDYPLSDCKVAQQDHSYCTEDGTAAAPPPTSSSSSVPCLQEPSTSSTSVLNEEPCQGSSSLNNIKSEQYESDPTLSEGSDTIEVSRYDILSSDEGLCPEYSENEDIGGKTSKKRKYREDSSENVCCASKKRSMLREQKSSCTLPKKDLKAKIKRSVFVLPSSKLSNKYVDKKHYRKYDKRIGHSSSSDSSLRRLSDKFSRHSKYHSRHHQKALKESSRETSEEKWHHSSSRVETYGAFSSRKESHDSGSDDSSTEERHKEHYSIKKYSVSSKTKKSSKKHKRRSKDKQREKVKKSGKKSSHRKKSKSKRHEVWYDSSSDYSERKRHKSKSGQKKKCIIDSDSSDSESSSYVKYKETTVKVKVK
ncbi:LOW QUALITY PROTEIN: E3 ubiquitin-protein ligase Topors-like [Macrobrachium nipponense]|uniref:LOW QUALITY PROTEIN: E3 ubiquitin-protein ligase Topors-like n=1 Tax=Macrobrachium nipponense TaxID=159736 RepID=UPI0030C8BD66